MACPLDAVRFKNPHFLKHFLKKFPVNRRGTFVLRHHRKQENTEQAHQHD
jgi:hypothetical protein